MQSNVVTMPVASFHYRPLSNGTHDALPTPHTHTQEQSEHDVQVKADALKQRMALERAAGFAEAETQMRQEFEARAQRESDKIAASLSEFEKTRKTYFARVETEVVQLALAIAGKIIHREAQVDPMLVAAIVQIALGQLKDGANATIRVRPEEGMRWRTHFGGASQQFAVNILEDGLLEQGDCILETELGAVNFSLNAQLKEVEQGFFDVLAQKPQA